MTVRFSLLVFITSRLFLYFLISTIEVIDAGGKTLSRGTEKGLAYARFKAHKFSFLNITNIGSDYVLKGSECGLACVNIPSCFSFNLAAFSDIMNGKILCELLPSDIYNNSKRFVASQFHHHYSIAVSEKLTLKNCTYFSVRFGHLSMLKQLNPTTKEKRARRKKGKKRERKILKRTRSSFILNSAIEMSLLKIVQRFLKIY